MLSDSENSGNEDEHQLTINDHYAKAYQERKEREELQKLKDKYGSDFEGEEENLSEESTDSESAESEDEDGEELTPVVDAAILRTLAMIKRKDPSIYQPERDVYEEEQQKVTNVAGKKKVKDKSKPITLRQAALEASLAVTGGSRSPSPESRIPTHVEEQRALRDETIAAFHGAVAGKDKGDGDDDRDQDKGTDDDGGGLLVPREKTKDELEMEEEEYKMFLQKEVGADLNDLVTVEKVDRAEADEDKISKAERDGKKKTKKGEESNVKTKEEEDHEFLMNYILNRGWIDKSTRHIPTYKEVVTSKKPKSKPKSKSTDEPPADTSVANDTKNTQETTNDSDAESDTSFESLLDHFEASYNFRFEEPGAATIQTFPRQLPDTVRRQESTRKDARARRQERKQAELEQKQEEVKRLKSLKMKEMRKKLERIGREGGRGKDFDEDDALQHLDLDADWDPRAHDNQMTELYGIDQGAPVDEEKPTWDDDIDIGDIIDPSDNYYQDDSEKTDKKKKKKKKKRRDGSDDDEGGVDVEEMDADVVHEEVEEDEEEWDGTEETRKRKLKEYMKELDSLDFNDMVGGAPTRFRYVPIKAESFALTPVEILMATDQELNQYVSIKKYAPYRHGAKWDNQRNEKLRELKHAISQRIVRAGAHGEWVAGYDGARGDAPAVHGREKLTKKRKGRKERMKAKAATLENGSEQPEQDTAQETKQQNKRGHEKKRKHEEVDVTRDADPQVEEIPSMKRKRRHKKKSEAKEVAS